MTRRNQHSHGAPASDLVLLTRSLRSTRALLCTGPFWFPCAVGRSGLAFRKREGDGATPAGRFAIRQVFYRPDRVRRPRTRLPVRAIRKDDGWCDIPGHRNYNRFVVHPSQSNAERLKREDALYDLVAVLGYNDRPRVQGRGSAIFLHLARPGYQPTAGCIALERAHLERLLARLRLGADVRIGSPRRRKQRSPKPKLRARVDER